MDGMTRSEVAERADVNPETVRYYERRGLIPDPPRSSGGYRLYDEDYVDRIRFIGRAQELGFTLEEIKALLELRVDPDTTCQDVKQRTQEKRARVEAKIRDLQRIRRALTRLERACDGQGPTSECPILEAMRDEDALDSVLS